MKKTIRHSSYKAIYHVLGDKLGWVIVILLLIGWMSDSLLSLIHQFSPKSPFFGFNNIDLMVFIFCVLALTLFAFLAKTTTFSDKYKAYSDDMERDQREVLILTLSGYNGWGIIENGEKKNLEYSEFSKRISEMPTGESVEKLRQTPFNCNWLPLLQAIDHYKNLSEIIVITTAGERGSFEHISTFRTFVQKYLEPSKREISIKSQLNCGYIKKPKLIDDNKNGIASENLHGLAETILEIIDNLTTKYGDQNKALEKIAVEVTGGTAGMSAVLAAVTASHGIFFHYTDTHSLQSYELDISAS
ncbi:hypothetical protein [Marinomonas sp.]|uniref:hypothetical protein n=1 Tax=Marinomonas sp. TaxID=1904862 RepID=UPI003BADAE4A